MTPGPAPQGANDPLIPGRGITGPPDSGEEASTVGENVRRFTPEEVNAIYDARRLFGPGTTVALFEHDGQLHVEARQRYAGHAVHVYEESNEGYLRWLDDAVPWHRAALSEARRGR